MIEEIAIAGDAEYSDGSGYRYEGFRVRLLEGYDNPGIPEGVAIRIGPKGDPYLELSPNQIVALVEAIGLLDEPGWNALEPIRELLEAREQYREARQ